MTSNLDYLTQNCLTNYPFKDGVLRNMELPVAEDVFADLQVFPSEPADSRIFLKSLAYNAAGAGAGQIVFASVTEVTKTLTIAFTRATAVMQIGAATPFVTGAGDLGVARAIFGPGITALLAALAGSTVTYTASQTELSPSAILCPSPKITSISCGNFNFTTGVVDEIVTVASGESADFLFGHNTNFEEITGGSNILVREGLGSGRSACPTGAITDVRTLNKVMPNGEGGLFLKADDCYTLEALSMSNKLALSDYKNFLLYLAGGGNALYDAVDQLDGSLRHGFVIQNNCKPRCAPASMTAYSKYLSRVTDGVKDLFKYVANAEIATEAQLQTVNPLHITVATTVIAVEQGNLSGVSGYFLRGVHEGRSITINFVDEATQEVLQDSFDYVIEEVIDKQTIRLSESIPAGSYIHLRVWERGVFERIENQLTNYNLQASKLNQPYSDVVFASNEGVDSFGLPVTYLSIVASLFNPTKDTFRFRTSFTILVNATAVESTLKTRVKQSDGDVIVFYGSSDGTLACRCYAQVEQTYFAYCSTPYSIVRVRTEAEVGGLGTEVWELVYNGEKEIAVNPAPCSGTDILTDTIYLTQDLEWTYTVNIPLASSLVVEGAEAPEGEITYPLPPPSQWLYWMNTIVGFHDNQPLVHLAGTTPIITPGGLSLVDTLRMRVTKSDTTSVTFLLTIIVNAVPIITNTDTTVQLLIGDAVSYQINAVNYPTSYTSSGALPQGLSFDTSTGRLQGIPVDSVSSVLQFTASNNQGVSEIKEITFVAFGASLITSASTTTAVVNTPFEFTLTAGSDPESFGAIGLPTWLTLTQGTEPLPPRTATLSGTPTVATNQVVSVWAVNAMGTGRLSNLTIQIFDVPTITSVLTQDRVLGSSVWYKLIASGNPSSYGITNLPDGVSFSASTQYLTGTPTAAGTYDLPMTVSNTQGSNSKTLRLRVFSAPVINSNLSRQVVGNTDFTYQITATSSPTNYAIGLSPLPDDWYFDTTTGLLEGVAPTTDLSFEISASNLAGMDTRTLALIVTSVANTPTFGAVTGTPDGVAGAALDYDLTVEDAP